MFAIYLVVFANVLLKWSICDDSSWHIEKVKNPNCPSPCEKHDVWYIRATNATSSLHSFICASETFPVPTILMIHSSNNETSAHIDWDTLNISSLSSIKIENITQSYSAVLHKLIEYNDESDNVTVSWVPDDETFGKMHYLSDWQWGPSQTSQEPNSSIWHLNYTGTSSNPIFSKSGKVVFKIMISQTEQHNPQMPHLTFVPGLQLQFELALDNLTTNYTNGRFALQMALISNQYLPSEQEFGRESRFSIDDEITPGTFEVINMKLADPVYSINGSSSRLPHLYPPAYLQTKPICFTDEDYREIKTSRDTLVAHHQNKSTSLDLAHIEKSFARAFYADKLSPGSQQVGIRLLNISFGTVADGFYENYRYIVWTASFGLGEPPVQKLSVLVIGLIVLSIVIVISSVIFGTLLILIIRARQRRHQFSLLRESNSDGDMITENTAL